MTSTPIATIPSELLQKILLFCHPRDVASFSQTCEHAYDVIYFPEQQYLWRELFLSSFDDPRPSLSPSPQTTSKPGSLTSPYDWRTELQRRVRVEVLAMEDADHREVLEVLMDAITQASPIHPSSWTSDGYEPSPNLTWAANVVEDSSLLRFDPLWTQIELTAHLRALFVQTLLTDESNSYLDHRLRARTYVYDLRNYVRSREWGPYREFSNGLQEDADELSSSSSASASVATRGPPGPHEVDWTHINALAVVVTANLRDIDTRWPEEALDRPPLLTKGLEATRAYSARGTHPEVRKIKEDWAGVDGHWLRIVCFCDYHDLIRFNANGHRPSFFDNDIDEATRLLSLNLRFVSVETDPSVLATLPDPSRPPIQFVGHMRGVGTGQTGSRATKGTVRLMKDGNIRWTFVSRYDGTDQWSSEGVQLGGVCSAAGVVGTWTGFHHERGDPAGPFWLWKTDTEIARPPWPE